MESSSTTTAERTTPSQPQVSMDSDQQALEPDPVESWEELADDSGRPNPPPAVGEGKETSHEGAPSSVIAGNPKHAVSVDTKEAVPKGADEGVAMDDEAVDDSEVAVKDPIDQSSTEKKPSPPTERITKAMSKAAAPVKSKEDKEILNIVFIGHVGKGRREGVEHCLYGVDGCSVMGA